MQTLARAISGVEVEASDLILELSAIKQNPSKAVDSAMFYLGLESATALRAEISEEGILSWIGNKIKALGVKILFAINKIYARLTGTTKRVNSLIKKIEAGEKVKLPISPEGATALIGATASIISVIYIVVRSGYSGYNRVLDKIKDYEKTAKFYREEAEDTYRRGGFSAMSTAAAYDRSADRYEEMKRNEEKDSRLNNPLYIFLKKISKLLSDMPGAIKALGDKYKKAEDEAVRVKDMDTQSHSIADRVKLFTECVLRTFRLIRKWFASLPNLFKKKSNPNNLPVLYNNIERM